MKAWPRLGWGQEGVTAVHRNALLFLIPLCIALPACESLGIKANITSFKSMNGKTEVKQREAKNWAEFEDAMGEVATDFSDVAKEAGKTTHELAKALVEAPPPGTVKLGDISPDLQKYEGNERFDFVHAARQKPGIPYDFTYVRIGVASYDDFFRTAAELYAIAFQIQETTRRLGKAREAKMDQEEGEAGAYFKDLETLARLVGAQGAQLVSKTAELVSRGQALIASAPTSILNPKTVLHMDLIVAGLEQSIGLIKESAGLIGEATG
jgi:hypothetical protein